MEVIANEYSIDWGRDESILKLYNKDNYTTVCRLATTELYTLSK
jgi:hypothetical protein